MIQRGQSVDGSPDPTPPPAQRAVALLMSLSSAQHVAWHGGIGLSSGVRGEIQKSANRMERFKLATDLHLSDGQ